MIAEHEELFNEFGQLQIRIEKLKAILETDTLASIRMISDYRADMEEQLECMIKYRSALMRRVVRTCDFT